MTQKYFIGKCGGEDCPQRFKTVKITHGTLSSSYDYIFKCNIDAKENPDCENCPHGKTIDEFKKDIAEVWLAMPKADNTDPKEYADTLAQNIIDKALLGGEQK